MNAPLMGFTVGERLPLTSLIGILILLVNDIKAECSTGTIERAMSTCFVSYNAHVANIDFYKGVDVETLRSICTAMKLAFQCTHRKCPGMSHEGFMEDVPSEIKNVMDICVYENIYEVYARNQNCFLQTITSSERCYNNYQASTQNLIDDVKAKRPTATDSLCLEYSKMVQCIKASVSTQCTAESASLVDLLIRPSIRFSERCQREGISTTVKPLPPQKPTMSNSVRDDTRGGLDVGDRNSGSKDPEYSVQGAQGNSSSKTFSSSIRNLAFYLIWSLLTIILTNTRTECRTV